MLPPKLAADRTQQLSRQRTAPRAQVAVRLDGWADMSSGAGSRHNDSLHAHGGPARVKHHVHLAGPSSSHTDLRSFLSTGALNGPNDMLSNISLGAPAPSSQSDTVQAHGRPAEVQHHPEHLWQEQRMHQLPQASMLPEEHGSARQLPSQQNGAQQGAAHQHQHQQQLNAVQCGAADAGAGSMAWLQQTQRMSQQLVPGMLIQLQPLPGYPIMHQPQQQYQQQQQYEMQQRLSYPSPQLRQQSSPLLAQQTLSVQPQQTLPAPGSRHQSPAPPSARMIKLRPGAIVVRSPSVQALQPAPSTASKQAPTNGHTVPIGALQACPAGPQQDSAADADLPAGAMYSPVAAPIIFDDQ